MAGGIRLAPKAAPFVRRQLSREGGRAIEILGHAIEYLADEYAVDLADKGPLGSADPRVEAIQILKAAQPRYLFFRYGDSTGVRTHKAMVRRMACHLSAR